MSPHLSPSRYPTPLHTSHLGTVPSTHSTPHILLDKEALTLRPSPPC